jgi:hypothetical protein
MFGLGDRQQLAHAGDFSASRRLPHRRELIEAPSTIAVLPARRVHLRDPSTAQQPFDGSVERARTHVHAARGPLPHVDPDSVAVLRAVH